VLSLGFVDGRNIWKSDLNAKLDILEPLHQSRGPKLWNAPSCSLIHMPISLQHESKLPAEMKNWLCFAFDKLDELQILNQALLNGRKSVADALQKMLKVCNHGINLLWLTTPMLPKTCSR
jgi:5-methyltetrahydropteroyltriglutamate--homocysteine methyltransferase